MLRRVFERVVKREGLSVFKWHLLLFFLAGFNGYLAVPAPYSTLSATLVLVLLIGGVWLLGWWALLTWAIGFGYGTWLYRKNERHDG
jgi:apolipoprotein N-acyltransferase